MGYNVRIEREGSKISLNEWIKIINEDSEFELVSDFNVELPEGGSLTTEIPNSGLWKKDIAFVYDQEVGTITVKNPDIVVIKKMISISLKMNATVIGDENEIYDSTYIEKEKNSSNIDLNDYKNIKTRLYNPNKKWWQFWKKGTHL
jgi:hypothetical protein